MLNATAMRLPRVAERHTSRIRVGFEDHVNPRVLIAGLIVSVAFFGGLDAVDACPMCAQALDEGASGQSGNVAQAFQASILFMLSMPFILLGAFAAGFYRLYQSGRARPDDPGLSTNPEAPP
jgi:hypothetical protein